MERGVTMTLQKQDILEDFYEGNTKVIQVEIKEDGELKPLDGCELTYVMTDRTDYDIVHIRKQSYKGEQEIKVVGVGKCEIFINGSDTIDKHGKFRHHLNVVDETNREATVFTGLVVIHETSGKRYREIGKPVYLEGKL